MDRYSAWMGAVAFESPIAIPLQQRVPDIQTRWTHINREERNQRHNFQPPHSTYQDRRLEVPGAPKLCVSYRHGVHPVEMKQLYTLMDERPRVGKTRCDISICTLSRNPSLNDNPTVLLRLQKPLKRKRLPCGRNFCYFTETLVFSASTVRCFSVNLPPSLRCFTHQGKRSEEEVQICLNAPFMQMQG